MQSDCFHTNPRSFTKHRECTRWHQAQVAKTISKLRAGSKSDSGNRSWTVTLQESNLSHATRLLSWTPPFFNDKGTQYTPLPASCFSPRVIELLSKNVFFFFFLFYTSQMFSKVALSSLIHLCYIGTIHTFILCLLGRQPVAVWTSIQYKNPNSWTSCVLNFVPPPLILHGHGFLHYPQYCLTAGGLARWYDFNLTLFHHERLYVVSWLMHFYFLKQQTV